MHAPKEYVRCPQSHIEAPRVTHMIPWSSLLELYFTRREAQSPVDARTVKAPTSLRDLTTWGFRDLGFRV